MKQVKSIIGKKSGHTRQAVVMNAWLRNREFQKELLTK